MPKNGKSEGNESWETKYHLMWQENDEQPSKLDILLFIRTLLNFNDLQASQEIEKMKAVLAFADEELSRLKTGKESQMVTRISELEALLGVAEEALVSTGAYIKDCLSKLRTRSIEGKKD